MRQQPVQSIDWKNVDDSSNVGATYFDEHTQTICVRFLNGGLYTYVGASEEIYMGLVHASSVGKYLNNVVKSFPYTRWEDEQSLIAHLNT